MMPLIITTVRVRLYSRDDAASSRISSEKEPMAAYEFEDPHNSERGGLLQTSVDILLHTSIEGRRVLLSHIYAWPFTGVT